MNDAFGEKIKKGMSVLYAVRTGYGTVYNLGKVVDLHPGDQPCQDRCSIEVSLVSNGPAPSGITRVCPANIVIQEQ